MKKRRIQAFAVLLVLALGAQTGCAAQSREGTQEQSQPESPGEQQEQTDGIDQMSPGDSLAGFTLESSSENGILQSQIDTFSHEKSGAKLVCIRNEDPELAFGIYFNTPVVDETDTNHVFEHAIIISSEKYPSSNLFFDLANKSYSTFVNAATYSTFTGYPLSSYSQEQLTLMMDAYLSCMEAPDILTNENIFKREAVRYELQAPEDPITMTGTVYSEDFGSLTDVNQEAYNNVADALYPGEVAANSIGRAHRNYQGLTYEHTRETYERCYSFDNSIILLYGDMDYEAAMTFIDSEYLSKSEKRGTDLSQYFNQDTPEGYVETTVPCPAYEGDTAENASRIDYAVSLEKLDWNSLLYWTFLSDALNQENSVFMKTLRESGISNQCSVAVFLESQKPYLLFTMYQADQDQAQTFREAVQKALETLAKNGMEEDVLRSQLKQIEISCYQIRDMTNAGVSLFPNIVNYWTHTGNVDYYDLYEKALDQFAQDQDQKLIKELAANVLSPKRSALVSTVPTPGLAEEIIEERDQYLAQMKENMSQEEIEELIRQTEEFNTWNAEENPNDAFIIDPDQVPDQEVYDDYTRTEEEGITFYQAPAQVEKIGKYALYFDASALSNEDLLYLELYKMILGEMATENHTEEEIRSMYGDFISNLEFTPMYPGKEGDGQHYPMLKASWVSLTEECGDSLDFLLEMLEQTDVTDSGKILELIGRYKDSCDLSRTGDPLSLANRLAVSYESDDKAYDLLCSGQDFYYFLNEVEKGLEDGENYGQQLAERLAQVREKLLTRNRLIFASVAPEESLETIHQTAAARLKQLPQGESLEPAVVLPERIQKLGVAVESSDQYSVAYGNMYEDGQEADLENGAAGRYLPFLAAASDRYLTPMLRFQNGVYSAGTSFNVFSGGMVLYSYSDPNVGKTVEIYENLGESLKNIQMSQEDLNGYILNTLGSAGLQSGVLTRPMTAIEYEIVGYSQEEGVQMANEIKNATLEDQEKAADFLGQIIENGGICTVGNEEALQKESQTFDQVISYRSGQ